MMDKNNEMSKERKMIYTVKGTIKKEQLGVTLGHEHFKWEIDEEYANQMYYDKKYNEEDIKTSHEMILPVLKKLHKLNCGAIVETSPPIGGQNVRLLKRLSDDSDIHIIPCTGHNVPKHIHTMFKDTFVSVMSKKWISDFEEGLDTVDGITIKPGYIKLLLEKGKLTNHDKDLLKAAVITNKKTGIPIHCHILEYQMVYDVIELLENEGADLDKFLWAHADQEGHSETIKYAYDKGIWIGFDMIQVGTYDKKLQYLKHALQSNQQDRILLSQDYELHAELKKNGSDHNCTSFFEKFIPYCEQNGIDSQVIFEMMTHNPSEFYDVK